jgi:hypothetical protein
LHGLAGPRSRETILSHPRDALRGHTAGLAWPCSRACAAAEDAALRPVGASSSFRLVSSDSLPTSTCAQAPCALRLAQRKAPVRRWMWASCVRIPGESWKRRRRRVRRHRLQAGGFVPACPGAATASDREQEARKMTRRPPAELQPAQKEGAHPRCPLMAFLGRRSLLQPPWWQTCTRL